MKVLALVCMACTAGISAAAGPSVPAAFLGTWAVAPVDCLKVGHSTLRIDATTVRRQQLQGYITAGATPGYETLEVLFESKEAPTGRDVRTYRLAADGSKLLELRAGKVVETRTRCAAFQK
jgi:hypothetical protein